MLTQLAFLRAGKKCLPENEEKIILSIINVSKFVASIKLLKKRIDKYSTIMEAF